MFVFLKQMYGCDGVEEKPTPKTLIPMPKRTKINTSCRHIQSYSFPNSHCTNLHLALLLGKQS
jgi:hypothetical protein